MFTTRLNTYELLTQLGLLFFLIYWVSLSFIIGFNIIIRFVDFKRYLIGLNPVEWGECMNLLASMSSYPWKPPYRRIAAGTDSYCWNTQCTRWSVTEYFRLPTLSGPLVPDHRNSKCVFWTRNSIFPMKPKHYLS